jgi:hypothetical protein
MVKFGDVFRYGEKEYVYLAKTDDIIYAAQILDSEKSAMVLDMRLRLAATGQEKLKDTIVFCFVQLSTEKFKDRLAHFKDVAANVDIDCTFDVIRTLDLDDLKDIKTEITDSSFIPRELKELVEGIELV